MFGLDKIQYDNTDANTIAASDTIGAFVKAGTDGAEIDSKLIGGTEWLQVAAAFHDGSGNAISSTGGALDVNIAGIDLDGVYHAVNNPTPDNIGSIFHTRAASPGAANQTFRSTGGSPSADDLDPANIHALDANSFMLAWDGSAWDRLTATAGALDVNLASTDIDLAVSDVATTLQNRAQAVDNVGEVELKSGATELTGRKYLWVQNLGPREIYLGKTGVTSANGIRLGRNAIAEFRLGTAAGLYAIGTNASAEDVRVMAAS